MSDMSVNAYVKSKHTCRLYIDSLVFCYFCNIFEFKILRSICVISMLNLNNCIKLSADFSGKIPVYFEKRIIVLYCILTAV